MATALVSGETKTRMASSDLSHPTLEAPDVSNWRRARLPFAAVAAAATLYFVIAAVLKTDALEWFGSPWGDDDEVVVKHEPTRAFGTPAGPARADSVRASGRGASATPKRTTRTRGRSSPAADGRDAAGDAEEAAPGADTNTPGRGPAARPASPAPASAPAPAATNPSQESKPEGGTTVTLPPPLPPVEVILPPVAVEPPPLPVNPPPLPVNPLPLPVTPPSVPPLQLPTLPALPTLP
jgi:hypothetical protein